MSKLKRKFYKHLWLFKPLSYLTAIATVIFIFIWLTPKAFSLFKKSFLVPKTIISIINPSIQYLNSSNNRTNILLLGIGGGNHDGADLTDSIMLISINKTTADTVLISLPRDIWVESLSVKLNKVYQFGEVKQVGGGLILAKSAVSEIINQPVHYAVLLDFSGFKEAIDIVGGISVNVPHSFIDNQYPIPGKESIMPEKDRYEILEFKSGQQTMDGDIALKYVRSRHAEGIEGTDYARSQRQQRIILSLKDKLLKANILFNFKKLEALKNVFNQSIKTDIPSMAYLDLFKLGIKLDQTNIRTGIIDQGSESEDIPALLYNPPSSLYGQWVLIPTNNNWEPVFEYVQEVIYQNQ
ncbi:MAG: LCP family protein [Candidatus Beckwithbacteria bacterium]|nr:LCP family protein [Patescibacteria group bacterium]